MDTDSVEKLLGEIVQFLLLTPKPDSYDCFGTDKVDDCDGNDCEYQERCKLLNKLKYRI